MGVDLDLLPIEGIQEDRTWELSVSVLRFERRAELWDDVKKLPCKPLKVDLRCHVARLGNGEQGWGSVEKDAYGEPVQYVRAKEFAALKNHPAIKDNDTNRAIIAYLLALHPATKIALYWC